MLHVGQQFEIQNIVVTDDYRHHTVNSSIVYCFCNGKCFHALDNANTE
jgi:hypothetical protein